MDADFVIAGAGPVGLTMALLLAKMDARVIVLERDPAMHQDWRASTFHPPTLEMAEEMGIVRQMLDAGVVAAKYQIRDWSNGRFAEYDHGVLGDETKYPFRLQLEQYKYAAIIAEELKRLANVEMRFGAPVVSVEGGETGAAVVVEPDGRRERVEGRWVVGADGSSSAVRQSLGLGFEGSTYPVRFLLLSVDAPLEEWFPDIAYVNYIADSGDTPGMVLRIPDLWRVSFQIPDDISDEEAKSDAYVMRRLNTVLGQHEAPMPKSRQVFRVHKRAAETFRVGRVVLIGDAAHNNSPHGGMGLNSGIHDAFDLAGVFRALGWGQECDAAVTAWAERRRKVALDDVQRIADRNTNQFASKDKDTVGPALRAAMELAADPVRARRWMMEASMLESVRRWYRPAADGSPFRTDSQS